MSTASIRSSKYCNALLSVTSHKVSPLTGLMSAISNRNLQRHNQTHRYQLEEEEGCLQEIADH